MRGSLSRVRVTTAAASSSSVPVPHLPGNRVNRRYTHTWLFDLDDTLHNASAHIFPHLNGNMTIYLMRHLGLGNAEADALRVRYWHQYGATMWGMKRHHGTDPVHFLTETHDFIERLPAMLVFERALRGMLHRLPGRKIVFSNGPQHYVDAVLDCMGIRACFDAVCGIEQQDFHSKPNICAFRRLLSSQRLNARRCILVEDSTANLSTAKALRMKTVLVSRRLKQPAYVDVKITSILDLQRVAGHLLR